MNVNCKEYQHQITLLLYDELAEGFQALVDNYVATRYAKRS